MTFRLHDIAKFRWKYKGNIFLYLVVKLRYWIVIESVVIERGAVTMVPRNFPFLFYSLPIRNSSLQPREPHNSDVRRPDSGKCEHFLPAISRPQKFSPGYYLIRGIFPSRAGLCTLNSLRSICILLSDYFTNNAVCFFQFFVRLTASQKRWKMDMWQRVTLFLLHLL